MNKAVKGALAVVAAAATLAVAPLMNKQLVATMDPLAIAAWRTALGCPLIYLTARFFGQHLAPGRHDFAAVLYSGLGVVAIPFAALAFGQQTIPSGTAGIIYGLTPVFVAAFAARFLPDERPNLMTLVSILIGIGGLAVLLFPALEHGLSGEASGMIITMAGPVAYAAGSVGLRKQPPVPPLALTAAAYGVAAIVLTIAWRITFPADPFIPTTGWWQLILLTVVGSAMASTLAYLAILTVGAIGTSFAMLLMPVFSLVYGASFLSEPVTLRALGGVALIAIAGLIIIRERRKQVEKIV